MLYFFLRYNSRSRQVGVYDVRNDAKVPSTGMIGDDIYIPPSETGSNCKFLQHLCQNYFAQCLIFANNNFEFKT